MERNLDIVEIRGLNQSLNLNTSRSAGQNRPLSQTSSDSQGPKGDGMISERCRVTDSSKDVRVRTSRSMINPA